jgi:hypothetical protein
MKDRTLKFVEGWALENIQAVGYPAEGDKSEAEGLASSCLTDASAEGISEAEIKESVGDLTDFMYQAIVEANDQEVRRLAERDD